MSSAAVLIGALRGNSLILPRTHYKPADDIQTAMDNEYDSERFNGSNYALYYYDWNDTSFGDFVTPFSKTSTRIAFIVSYVLVFATCLIGK